MASDTPLSLLFDKEITLPFFTHCHSVFPFFPVDEMQSAITGKPFILFEAQKKILLKGQMASPVFQCKAV